jgi:hypothetical protein
MVFSGNCKRRNRLRERFLALDHTSNTSLSEDEHAEKHNFNPTLCQWIPRPRSTQELLTDWRQYSAIPADDIMGRGSSKMLFT